MIFPQKYANLVCARQQSPFLLLAYQARCGNALSIRTYNTYCDIVAGVKKPRNISDSKVVAKLLSMGLCVMHNGKLQIETIYIDDQIPRLRKKK